MGVILGNVRTAVSRYPIMSDSVLSAEHLKTQLSHSSSLLSRMLSLQDHMPHRCIPDPDMRGTAQCV